MFGIGVAFCRPFSCCYGIPRLVYFSCCYLKYLTDFIVILLPPGGGGGGIVFFWKVIGCPYHIRMLPSVPVELFGLRAEKIKYV